MNREIKFRAWDDSISEMLSMERLLRDYSLAGITVSKSHHLHIMQYVGLKDKNGKEIYEGDIFGSEQLRCIVKRDDDGAYRMHFIDERISPISILDPKVSRSEVIGNIFQNPDLLNQ